MLDETIAAISTPLGEAGLAVIRISGDDALAVADRCFRPSGNDAILPTAARSHTLHHGHAIRQGQHVDEVMLAVMRAPRSFTREDTVEITCHGGMVVARAVLDAAMENGARLAMPGEFTKRAFLNGRLDLAQAEAVMDLIHARTEMALTAANEQLAGKLSWRINQLRDDLMRVLTHVEAHIDFPDEDIEPSTLRTLLEKMEDGTRLMDDLLCTAREGQLVRRGIRAAIIGRPNAGKSSLLNHLLGRDRAIVSPTPGTTRDTISETADIKGIAFEFVDTAGLRAAGSEIELEGIRRSRETISRADLLIHVLDASEPVGDEDHQYLDEFAKKKAILVRNKTDLPERMGAFDAGGRPEVNTCCLTGEGIEALKKALRNLVWSGEITAGMLEVMINARHQDALRRAREAAGKTIQALQDELTLELVALDLRIALNAVGEVVGKTTTEDLLDSIFSQFCIGK